MFRRIKHKETQGALFTLTSALLWGLFPILVNSKSQTIPPIFFGGIISIFTAIGSLIWMVSRKKTKECKKKEAYFSLFMVSLCIIIIPNILFFIGTRQTSGINSSVLMLSEILFTLFFTPFFGEKNTIQKYLGSIGILVGGALVLFKGNSINLNMGDLLILLSTVTFPIGNFYSKRALYIVSPSVILTARYGIGGIVLLLISFTFEPIHAIKESFIEHYMFFILIGCILLSVCKITFYEGMKRLDISKVISLEMTYPLFSVLFLYFCFDTDIQLQQILGVVIIIIGGFFTIRRKSERHSKLKYNPN